MRAIWLCFLRMAASMRRDAMLAAVCLAPVFAGLLFRFAIPFFESVMTEHFLVTAVLSPYYGLIDVFTAMLPSTMFGFVSAMVFLEEADEKTAAYLFVTPLGKTGYLTARLGIPAAAAFSAVLVLLPLFRLMALSSAAVFLYALVGMLQGLTVALLIITFSSNRLEGMAVAKLSTLPAAGAAVPFFIRGNAQYMLCFLPSFWMGKAACKNRLLYMIPAAALSALWICVLLKRYQRKI